MALVILSTVASALSISGKDGYICGWNEVAEAKSLRSENGLRAGQFQPARPWETGLVSVFRFDGELKEAIPPLRTCLS